MWIEDYLSSIDENELRRIFLKLREQLKPNYIKLIHSPVEFGRDIIELVGNNLNMYQLKMGDIDTKKWESEIEPQIRKMFTVPVDDPQINEKEVIKRGYIVFNGNINVYTDRPVKYLLEEYKNTFNWDITLINLSSLVKMVVDYKSEGLLLEEELWYEFLTLIAKVKKRISDVNDYDSFIIDELQTSSHFHNESFNYWFIKYSIKRIDEFIKLSKTTEERDYFKFYKFCIIEISIALFDMSENIEEYFKLIDYGDLMMMTHQLLGPTSNEVKVIQRIFGLDNLIKSAKGFYKYTSDDEVFSHVNAAFNELWYFKGNLGRNIGADEEEINTIDTLAGLMLLLFEKKKLDIAKSWLIRIGDYLVEANKINELDELTAFANFSFLEYLLLFNFKGIFDKYKCLFSKELSYLMNDKKENICFENNHNYNSVLSQYKDVWQYKYFIEDEEKDKVSKFIKIAYSYRFNRDVGYGLEYIQKLIRKNITEK